MHDEIVAEAPDGRPPHGGRGLKCRHRRKLHGSAGVALHTGGRGLKYILAGKLELELGLVSPSTRGAWIEIPFRLDLSASAQVTLHTGGVD